MKLCLVILSGAADQPVQALGDRTPLEAADLPAVASLVGEGRLLGVVPFPKRVPPSTEAALAALLGRDPLVARPEAGALLAAARGVSLEPADRAFRCDLVNLYGGAVVDPTAGRLSGREAEILVSALQDALGSETVRFLPGDRWRALAIVSGGQAEEARTESPASFLGERLEAHSAVGPGCELVRSLVDRAPEVLAEHEINTVRIDLGENPANGIWIWGGGRPRPLGPPAPEPGAALGRHPSFLGLAKAVGLATEHVADLAALGEAAVRAVDRADLVVVHVEEPLDCSRLGEAEAKVHALEAADEAVVAPLAERVVRSGAGKLMVAASHVAATDLRRDLPGTVPAVVAGAGTARYGAAPFTEAGAAAADLVVSRGHELLEFAGRQ